MYKQINKQQPLQVAGIGLISIDRGNLQKVNNWQYKDHIKVLYLPEGYKLTIDFAVYQTQQPSLFFVTPSQILQVEKAGSKPGHVLFYNRDFYCIRLNDAEVHCEGILFNNIHNMPLVRVYKEETAFFNYLYLRVEQEFKLNDISFEEMLRTYLKQLLIKATRLWTQQHLQKRILEKSDHLDFFRHFTRLVDAHYKYKHKVADYADLLFMEPKTITHKFKRLNLPQPSEIIKNRIVLEGKRMLVHTSLTAKEIGYHLGYDDPAYFSRLFQLKTGQSPLAFRKIHRTYQEKQKHKT